MDSKNIFKFNGYQKVPGFFNVSHNGGVSIIINGSQITIKTVFFIKRKFSIYDVKPPQGMTKKLFDLYKTYKLEAKVMTTSDSIRKRFDIMLSEYNRLHPIIMKDPKRLFDVEQKRTLYFRQQGQCAYCGRKMSFSLSSGHHILQHSEGGKTADLSKAVLLHENCHKYVEKQVSKGKQPVFLYA